MTNPIEAIMRGVDRFHQRRRFIAFPYAVLKKFGDDQGGNLAALLTDAKGDKASLERALGLAKRFEIATNPSFLDTLGWVYFKLGQNDRALPIFEKAAAAAPKSAVYQYHLGMALYRQGDMKSAKAHLKQAVDTKANFAGLEEAKQTLAKM